MNYGAAPGVRKSLKGRHFRLDFQQLTKSAGGGGCFNFPLTLGAYPFQQTRSRYTIKLIRPEKENKETGQKQKQSQK